jgi:hypothetical protein
MAYLDPVSNPGSKPQRFSVKNCKSSTSGPVPPMMGFFPINKKVQFTKWEKNKLQILW